MPPAAEAPIRHLLTHLCAAPELHARFLNTLSLLEHIGSRKIMVSHSRAGGPAPGGDTLRHLAEETRHAWFFKRAAQSAARKSLSYNDADILAGPQARLYMGRLDARVARAAPGAAAYYYMSLIVELRAIWFYEIYQAVLKDAGHPLNLAGLLAEETRHLEEMRGHLTALGEDIDAQLPALVAFEQTCYDKLLAALMRSLPQPDRAAATG